MYVLVGKYYLKTSTNTEKMAEEVQNASVTVPRATVTSIMVNGALGFGMLIGILFSLGDDLKSLLKSPYGYPFIQIFMNSTRSRSASTVLTAILLALIFFSTIGVVATASRMTWSFARDRGLPGWRTLSKVWICHGYRFALPLFAYTTNSLIPVGRLSHLHPLRRHLPDSRHIRAPPSHQPGLTNRA